MFTYEVSPLNFPVFADVLKKATSVNSLLKSVPLNSIVVCKNLMNTANKNKLQWTPRYQDFPRPRNKSV